MLGGRPRSPTSAARSALRASLPRRRRRASTLRTRFPLVSEWVERTNHEGALNARTFGQKLYSLAPDGALVGRSASSDGGDWLADDEIPETLDAIVAVLFEEMWPALVGARDALRSFIASDAHAPGGELPGKTFFATPGFEALQTGHGPLTHAFEIGGIAARRMVVPYQFWMLDRIERAIRPSLAAPAARFALEAWLARFRDGEALLDLAGFLAGCRVRKDAARLYSV